MRRKVILDTGPLVAFLNSSDKHHDWIEAQWAQIHPPLLTCEAVLSEACFLLRDWKEGCVSVLKLLERGVLKISFCLSDNISSVSALIKKYRNIPTSLADACLVRMAELHDGSSILTLDSDFRIYRKHHRKVIPLWLPADQ